MKTRLDQALVARGLCESREQAKRLILAGQVVVEGTDNLKPGLLVPDDREIRVKEQPKYVGRGGLKLEGALDAFGIDPAGRVGLDLGASTGGFTDCLLQRGAVKVFAFDVGTNQLAWKLRSDPRVVSREGFNVRYMTPEDVGEPVDLVVIDVSFISLTKILPAAFGVLRPGGDLVCLIKPQFELRREQIGKGGIVRDPALRDEAVVKIRDFVTGELAKDWRGLVESPISGTDGNVEYLAWLRHPESD
ncbi:MAG: TlyA family RNA methyltransferase [Verrucomicrobiales bacterium]|nr:TlyA family RNA methyltransferase [Verrucomicrobiales bacterium]